MHVFPAINQLPGYCCGSVEQSEHRSCLVQISGARVKLRDDRLEGGRRELELSGSPEQIQAAKNIVQVCIRMEQRLP